MLVGLFFKLFLFWSSWLEGYKKLFIPCLISESMERFSDLCIKHPFYLSFSLSSGFTFCIIFFFLHLVAKRATANSIAIRIWKRRTLQTRGVKEDFVELMGFELDFQALGKGEQEGKGSLGGLKWREWSHHSCSGCSGRFASGAMAGEGPECAVTPCG